MSERSQVTRRLPLPPGAMGSVVAKQLARQIADAHPSAHVVPVQNRGGEWFLHIYWGSTSDGPQSFVTTSDQAERILSAGGESE